jgi:hypothetical protein
VDAPMGPVCAFPAALGRRGPARRARTRLAPAPPTSLLKARWFPIIRPQARTDTSLENSRVVATPPFAANLDTSAPDGPFR